MQVIWAASGGNQRFAYAKTIVYAKTKTHISFAVTAKLISAFVFATAWFVLDLVGNPEVASWKHVRVMNTPLHPIFI